MAATSATCRSAALRHGIGYVIQSIGLFPHMNVAENIGIVPRLMGQAERRTGSPSCSSWSRCRAELAARYPRELSGGQAQRVGFARALAAGPKLMLMDEPFGALDPVTRDSLGRAYRDLHDRLGLTTLMVTHDVAEALAARRPDRRADRRPHPRRRRARRACSPARRPRRAGR